MTIEILLGVNMICQVEEFYIYLESDRIDLSKSDEIRKFIESDGLDCIFDDESNPLSVAVEIFYDRDEANDFKHKLLSEFGV